MRARATLVMVFVLMVLATLVWQMDVAEGLAVEGSTDKLASTWGRIKVSK